MSIYFINLSALLNIGDIYGQIVASKKTRQKEKHQHSKYVDALSIPVAGLEPARP